MISNAQRDCRTWKSYLAGDRRTIRGVEKVAAKSLQHQHDLSGIQAPTPDEYQECIGDVHAELLEIGDTWGGIDEVLSYVRVEARIEGVRTLAHYLDYGRIPPGSAHLRVLQRYQVKRRRRVCKAIIRVADSVAPSSLMALRRAGERLRLFPWQARVLGDLDFLSRTPGVVVHVTPLPPHRKGSNGFWATAKLLAQRCARKQVQRIAREQEYIPLEVGGAIREDIYEDGILVVPAKVDVEEIASEHVDSYALWAECAELLERYCDLRGFGRDKRRRLRETLRRLAAGASIADIAAHMRVSRMSVNRYRQELRGALGALAEA